jgi:hypothetical protein
MHAARHHPFMLQACATVAQQQGASAGRQHILPALGSWDPHCMYATAQILLLVRPTHLQLQQFIWKREVHGTWCDLPADPPGPARLPQGQATGTHPAPHYTCISLPHLTHKQGQAVSTTVSSCAEQSATCPARSKSMAGLAPCQNQPWLHRCCRGLGADRQVSSSNWPLAVLGLATPNLAACSAAGTLLRDLTQTLPRAPAEHQANTDAFKHSAMPASRSCHTGTSTCVALSEAAVPRKS